MRRVLLLGSGGSGKSTLARKLGEVTGLPVVHLDAHFWKPGWTPTEQSEWVERVKDMAARDRWIIDGNYGGTELAPRLARADTVLVMDLPRRVCIWRALKRATLTRKRSDMGPGCDERIFNPEYLKFLYWIWGYPKKRLPLILEAINKHPHLEVHRLRSSRDIERFLEKVHSEASATA